MTGGVHATIATVHRAVYRTYRRISEFVYHDQHGQRREEKRIYLYAAVETVTRFNQVYLLGL